MTKSSSNKTLVPALITVAGVGLAAGAAYLARQRKGEVKEFVVSRVLEAPAGRSSYTDLGQSLERAGTALAGRGARAGDTPANREVLGHIIGIERWGQNRLRMALGKKLYESDSYQTYRPAADTSLAELRDLLSQTRSGTVDLARQLHVSPPEEGATVNHNGLGPLTAKAWLRYLTQHADLESRKLRGAKEAGAVPDEAMPEAAPS
ncbi:DinB family protein [Deinococcus arenicola]|uniref:DinB family protein n=1 Tax=Deinococcus arenicola TaxID=2994950 RepID=A0ABU4DSL1_9DEIO|nr:DinB family protein [Deinococcus sp. ZS9-10]MDV6374870.1 DinB family protein [Deinococcus sp. ZS9-10]